MTRRELLAAAAVSVSPLAARSRMDKTRLSAITDEIGRSTDESIAFARRYGLRFIEIRNPPGSRREYYTLTEAEIKADALRFSREGLKVSFVNTSLLKFGWPGTEPVLTQPETAETRAKRLAGEQQLWDHRMENLRKAIGCAHTMGCDKIRVFTGWRVANPPSMFPRVAEVIGEMALEAAREKGAVAR